MFIFWGLFVAVIVFVSLISLSVTNAPVDQTTTEENPWIHAHARQPLTRGDTALALEKRALSAFNLERISYATSPLISVVTRTWKRPALLALNIESSQRQIVKNHEHCVLRDSKGKGMSIAEAALSAFASEYRGRYIMHLDDDDRFVSDCFTGDMERLIEENQQPAMIIFRVSILHDSVFIKSMPSVWLKMPMHGTICTNNVLVRRDVYQHAIDVIAQHHGGDYEFILKAILFSKNQRIVWHNATYCCVNV